MGQDSHRQPAVLETHSGVSGGDGRHRHLPLCPTLAVVFCRRVSPRLAVSRRSLGQYWGSLCFRGRSSPCTEGPIRGHQHLTCGLIRRLFLAKPVRSVGPMEARILG